MYNEWLTMPLEELCARTILEGGRLARDFPATEIARDANEGAAVRRTLDRMNAETVAGEHNDGGLAALGSILNRELDAETLDRGSEFCGSDDPELGSIGTVHEVRVLSDRGKRIDRLDAKLRIYLNMRDICRARLQAERLVFRHASG